MKKMALLVFGAISAPLGALWLLQGLGLVHVRPILCFANCEPVQGASPTWAIVGAFMVLGGVWAVFVALKRRPTRP